MIYKIKQAAISPKKPIINPRSPQKKSPTKVLSTKEQDIAALKEKLELAGINES
jgi:hypothetical protein